MNILFLVNSFPPEIRSASHLFYELAMALVAKGHCVTVVTGFPRYNVPGIDGRYRGRIIYHETMSGVRVVRMLTIALPRGIPFLRGVDHFLLSFMYLLGGLISGRHDVVLVYSPPLPLGLSAYVLGKVMRVPFIFNVQDIYPQTAIDLGLLKSKFLIKVSEGMERFIYRKAKYITVHSEGNKVFVAQRTDKPGKIRVIPNWVDTAFITPGPRDNEFRVENNLGAKFVVSFAGVMGYAQDLETVIEAAALLKSYEDIVFVLVGDGVKGEEVRRQAKRLGVVNVLFLPMQPREKYPLILEASDVCLVTLKKEVSTPVVPAKLLSIMASARPVVASLSAQGDAWRIVQEAQCGICVEPENPLKLAEAILELYRNPALGLMLGRNGRRYAKEHFSLLRCADLYENLFLQAVKGV